MFVAAGYNPMPLPAGNYKLTQHFYFCKTYFVFADIFFLPYIIGIATIMPISLPLWPRLHYATALVHLTAQYVVLSIHEPAPRRTNRLSFRLPI